MTTTPYNSLYTEWLLVSPTSEGIIKTLINLEDQYSKGIDKTTPEMKKLLKSILNIKKHIPTNSNDVLEKSMILYLLDDKPIQQITNIWLHKNDETMFQELLSLILEE